MSKSFSITDRPKGSAARAGIIHTPHGDIQTPAFSPVGTKANVKGVLPEQLRKVGAQVVLANTYHLYLQPGVDLVKNSGGVSEFMNWHGPTITDSGGFQVFSLGAAFNRKISKFLKEDEAEGGELEHAPVIFDKEVQSQHGQLAIIDDDGVTFTSHHDGSLHRFTPERSVEIQHALGPDIFFAFDECTAPTETYEYQREAMVRTHEWAKRSLKAHRQNLDARDKQLIFGIGQGGSFDDLRRESAKTIADMGFDGFGLGGSFSKKYGDNSLESALQMLAELPEDMPRHGLGVGEPTDVLLAIAHGVDMFDCVAPTRIGRHGSIYTKHGIIHLRGSQFHNDIQPLDPETIIPGTEGFTRSYVSHLIRSGEMLGSMICSLHNVGFIVALVDGARQAIKEGRFEHYREEFVNAYTKG
ncbi:MAG TPA: tRNA guanosine(34) transglycosylase Tgt [Candidatus Paceibacterota bacterium]